MLPIDSVELENYRGFKVLRVRGLTAINLFVGANNSGKTTLLEAIEAVVSTGSPFTLYRASAERGEYKPRYTPDADHIAIDLRHWFYGHRIDEGARLSVRANGAEPRFLTRTVERVPGDALTPPFVPGGLRLASEGGTPIGPLPLSPDHLLGAGAIATFSNFGLRLQPPVGFVTTTRVSPHSLARLWSDVVLTPGEARTLDALRLIEPRIERIALSERDGTMAKVLLKDATGPIPLGSLGEGVTRMLTLALHLALTRGGFLLIDELESGLHWSVMHRFWQFLVATARENQVQVFATTHSKDLVEALAELHRCAPELAADASVHRLEVGRDESVRIDAARIAEYIEMELEPR
jgi:energy-coupling factor transporter ATP-binding protein EcfA2